MQSPSSPSGRAPAPVTLRRVRRGRICRPHSEQTSSHLHQMGQGNSTPQQDDRDIGGSSQGEHAHGGESSQSSGRPTLPSPLRRSGRLRNSLTQWGGRLMRPGSSSAISHAASAPITPSNRVQSTRIRSRVGFPNSRSSPPVPSTGPSSPRYNGRPHSTPLSLPPMLSPELPNETNTEDVHMSDPPDGINPLYSPAEPEPSSPSLQPPVPSDPPSSSRRSRLSRVRTTLPNFLAEIGNSRAGGSSSRRSSQLFRPSLFDPFGGHDSDDDMDLDGPSSSNTATESSTRRTHHDFGSFGDPSTIDLLENPRVRPGEDQAAMLSRLLSVAAAMTAASLVGSSEQALTEAQDVAGDSVDGSFESFLRALQNGRLAAALRNGGNEMGGGVPSEPGSDGALAPLNFFRMFRFGASSTAHITNDSPDAPPPRMVPVIIVGIRSVTPRGSQDATENGPSPLIEQLANLSARRNRANHGNRRASMSAVGENQRTPGRATRPTSEVLFPTAPSIPDTPQGPHPPPSTPADPGLPFPNSILNASTGISSSGSTNPRSTETPSTSRAERGQSTPHGVPSVAQDNNNGGGDGNSSSSSGFMPPRRPGSEGTRSWIIYVLGGSYPENHPILTTPSLFTDVS